MGWGPEPKSGDVSWEGLDFTNIDVFMPQCYGQPGVTYPSTDIASPSKICEYWVNGGPVTDYTRAGFTPCKVPAEKLAVGLGKSSTGSNNPLDDYTDDLKKWAKAGYIIWSSKWIITNYNKCQ